MMLYIICVLQPVAKMLRHSNEKSASHTSVQYKVRLPPTLHSKLFLQVLSIVLYFKQL